MQDSQLAIFAFDTVAALSSLSMVLIVTTAWKTPDVCRSTAWYSMCLSFAVFPLFYLINVPFQFQSGRNPPIGMCTFQAVLVYAGPPAACTAVLCYVSDMAIGLYSALFKTTCRATRWKDIMAFLPTTVLTFICYGSVAALTSMDDIGFEPSHMFCTVGVQAPHAKFSAGLVLVVLLLMAGMKVWILVMLAKNWSAFRSAGNTNKDMRLSVFIRFTIFTLLIWITGGLSIVVIFTDRVTGAAWNILLVAIPFIAGLAFGTHTALIKTWVSWLPGRTSGYLQLHEKRGWDMEA